MRLQTKVTCVNIYAKRLHTHVQDPVVHIISVWWIMELPNNPPSSKWARVFKVLKLDTIKEEARRWELYRWGRPEIRNIQMEEARRWELYWRMRLESLNYTDEGGWKVWTIQMKEARKFELYRWRRPENENYTDREGQKMRTIQMEKARKWELYR